MSKLILPASMNGRQPETKPEAPLETKLAEYESYFFSAKCDPVFELANRDNPAFLRQMQTTASVDLATRIAADKSIVARIPGTEENPRITYHFVIGIVGKQAIGARMREIAAAKQQGMALVAQYVLGFCREGFADPKASNETKHALDLLASAMQGFERGAQS